MWRFCDLHIHTVPNEQCSDAWDPAAWVADLLSAGLDVVAVTDHDHVDHVSDAVAAAAGTSLAVVPGVELSTDRGHVLLLAPGSDGHTVLQEFTARVGARPEHQVPFDDVIAVAIGRRSDSQPFAQHLVTVGAHVDMEGSLLASNNPLSLEGQLQLASRLHALEVCRDEISEEWRKTGIKQSGRHFTLLKGSDGHTLGKRRSSGTWLYLPAISVAELRHAFALPESAVRFGAPPEPPAHVIESIEFRGGYHDGVRFDFCERSNAIIGPPNSGKSLVIDALKYVFGLSCDIPEVEAVSKARSKKCLPCGASIEVRVRTPHGPRILTRTVGGKADVQPPFRPIIFSQTELTRRGMASAPAIALLDLHVPGLDDLRQAIVDRAGDLEEQFMTLARTAQQAFDLGEVVSNPQDGLEATRNDLDTLVGTEGAAHRATMTVRVAQWREKAFTAVKEWEEDVAVQAITLPAAPPLPAGSIFERFMPKEDLTAIGGEVIQSLKAAVLAAGNEMRTVLERDASELISLQEQVHAELQAAGFEGGNELTERLDELRRRFGELEEAQQQLQEHERTLAVGILDLHKLLRETQDARTALSSARKAASREINKSMRTFFVHIDQVGVTDRIDGLIDDLKTGTYMRPDARRRIRDELDRPRLLEQALRRIQGVVCGTESSSSDQDRIVDEAINRGRIQDIARLATLWPGDGLSLEKKGSPPTPFSQLTEGLRALAIKEVSFAASDLPVVSDQPEDAVPTRSVFDSLVPTLREQRTTRQFIVVSHDANIVVASDVERVCSLGANDDGSPHTGSLFDPVIRNAALEHLEGGPAAFELRAARYKQLH